MQSADVVVFDRLVSDEILALVPDSIRRIDVGKMPGCHKVTQDRINTLLVELARDGLTVVRLKGGDPLIFARGSEEAEVLRAAGVAVTYVPGITAAQGAASSTGVPLTHRGLATGVRYVTGHRAKDARLDLDWASLASEDTTLVIYMGAANIAEIAFQLMRHGHAGRAAGDGRQPRPPRRANSAFFPLLAASPPILRRQSPRRRCCSSSAMSSRFTTASRWPTR